MVDIRSLNVGDQVLVKSDLIAGHDYNNVLFVDSMREYRGRIMTVREVELDSPHFNCDSVDVVRLEEDKNYCGWSEDMLDPVESVSLMDMLAENNV